MKDKDKKKKSKKSKGYLYSLPQDIPAVRGAALIGAYDCAYVVVMQEQSLDEMGVRAMAVNASILHLDGAERDGKRGSNDPVRFRTLYIETFLAVYPTCLHDIRSGRLVLPDDEQERATMLERILEKRVSEHQR